MHVCVCVYIYSWKAIHEERGHEQEVKRSLWEVLEGEKGREKCCDYKLKNITQKSSASCIFYVHTGEPSPSPSTSHICIVLSFLEPVIFNTCTVSLIFSLISLSLVYLPFQEINKNSYFTFHFFFYNISEPRADANPMV